MKVIDIQQETVYELRGRLRQLVATNIPNAVIEFYYDGKAYVANAAYAAHTVTTRRALYRVLNSQPLNPSELLAFHVARTIIGATALLREVFNSGKTPIIAGELDPQDLKAFYNLCKFKDAEVNGLRYSITNWRKLGRALANSKVDYIDWELQGDGTFVSLDVRAMRDPVNFRRAVLAITSGAWTNCDIADIAPFFNPLNHYSINYTDLEVMALGVLVHRFVQPPPTDNQVFGNLALLTATAENVFGIKRITVGGGQYLTHRQSDPDDAENENIDYEAVHSAVTVARAVYSAWHGLWLTTVQVLALYAAVINSPSSAGDKSTPEQQVFEIIRASRAAALHITQVLSGVMASIGLIHTPDVPPVEPNRVDAPAAWHPTDAQIDSLLAGVVSTLSIKLGAPVVRATVASPLPKDSVVLFKNILSGLSDDLAKHLLSLTLSQNRAVVIYDPCTVDETPVLGKLISDFMPVPSSARRLANEVYDTTGDQHLVFSFGDYGCWLLMGTNS